MKRIDKIMSKLDDIRNVREDLKQAEISANFGDDTESRTGPVLSPLISLIETKRKVDILHETESPASFVDDTESPAAPIYSPLTPLITRKTKASIVDETKLSTNFVVETESPAAPMFSPLTPLIANENKAGIIDESREQNSSPVPSMSPSTLEMFETLSKTLSPIKELIDIANNEELAGQSCLQDNKDDLTDFSADTDSDYVPDINSDSSVDLAVRSDQIQAAGDLADVEFSFDGCNNSEVAISVGRPKKGRKRKHPDFLLSQAKARKYANKCYLTKKKFVESKVFKDYSCSCAKKCHQQISREKRRQEFQKFVTLGSYEAQVLYIGKTVKEIAKSRSYTILKGNKSGKSRPRQYVRKYILCGIEVCRSMYINNFQISTKKVDISLKKNRNINSVIQDQRGQSSGGWNKTKSEDLEFIKNIINQLPKYESHYRRDQNNGCKYLKLGMTMQVIYDLYLEEFNKVNINSEVPKKPVSFSTLKRIFCNNFNLRCKSLKKDTCNKCDTLTIKIKNADTDDERREFEEEKNAHLKRAEDLRKAMNQDMKRAKSEQNFECLTFDMEKTLPLPRIPTSVVFYKRQLWFYNCSIHTASDNIGHCYVWVEGEAGRGSQEVGSCIANYIKHKLDPKVQHLVLWSDCCGGQNRNIKIVLMLKVILDAHLTLKTITFKFLESGHTFLPNDTDFSKIETMLKYHERIYTIHDYINIIKVCKRQNPLQVYRMKKNDFFSTQKLEKKIVNRKQFVTKEKVNWLKTKEILIDKNMKFDIFMRTCKNGEYYKLNIAKTYRGQQMDISENDLSLLWPNGKEIPQAKLNDLMSMLELIPKDCQEFYRSLKGNNNISEDIDGYDGELDFVPETDD